MRTRHGTFLLLNTVGGIAVLASYGLWLTNPSNRGPALWGHLGAAGQQLYNISMLAAAAGYFAFFIDLMQHELHRIPAEQFAWLSTLFTLILFPSALWMPLSFEYLDAPTVGLWWAVRGTLFVVGAASAALVVFLWRLPNPVAPRARALAIVGAIAFTFQTGVLDAFVWPHFFFAE